MVVPNIVPGSKPPPMLLLGAGAALLAGLIIRTLRRRHSRAATARGVEVTSTGRKVRQPASTRTKGSSRALLPASTARVTSSHATATVCEQ